MGAGTFLSQSPFAESQSASASGAPARSIDLPLLVVVIALIIFGLVMLFSASWDYSLAVYNSPMYMFERQLMWLALGAAVAFALSRFDYHNWRRLIVPAMGLTILLLMAVLLLHDISLGLIPLGVIMGVVGGLIYQQPDLSAAATVFLIGGLLFFLAGGDLKQIVMLLG